MLDVHCCAIARRWCQPTPTCYIGARIRARTHAMLAVLVAAALSAPVIDVGSPQMCRLVSQLQIDVPGQAGWMTCCESCLAPHLLQTDWVTVTTKSQTMDVTRDDEATLETVVDGSGFSSSELLARRVDTAVGVEKVEMQRSPCGRCVTATDCLQGHGYVNTWHRLCHKL